MGKTNTHVQSMAGKSSTALLGIKDVQITDKESALIDFKTNKIGGKPVSKLYCISQLNLE